MKYDNEITVLIDTNKEELLNILKNNSFKKIDEYNVNDIYMINKEYLDSDNLTKILNSILIRNIITEKDNIKKLTYKEKILNEKNEIIKQGKIEVSIDNVESCKDLLEHINYQELLRINDYIEVFINDKYEIYIQTVNDNNIYIEIEEYSNYFNKKYDLEEIKELINKLNIPIKNNDYFVKKAFIELNKKN